MLKFARTQDDDTRPKASDEVASLFSPYLSGTHATVEQRLRVIEPLLKSDDDKQRSLGMKAFEAALAAWDFISFYSFEFGAHSRDHGYWPRTKTEVKEWYGSALKLAGTVACSDAVSASQVGAVLAKQFRGLWSRAGVHEELERVCRAISDKQFWADGWIAVENAR